ncbi:hypothetical protein I4F81_006494 [Pyropia yezoensis]|uniref:Uncharacterized protein n=1 Tax=Pyropia yezoensis TaxID=2788 RepID=A0ACC3C1A7_PYRYE|nr:hypothetical protein I4F81_006494 [Neopyropia yezoensis]
MLRLGRRCLHRRRGARQRRLFFFFTASARVRPPRKVELPEVVVVRQGVGAGSARLRLHVVHDSVQLHDAHVLVLAAGPQRLHLAGDGGVPLLMRHRVLSVQQGVGARVEDGAAYMVDDVEEVRDDVDQGHKQK